MIGEEVIAYYGDAGDGEELFEKSKLVRCKDCKWCLAEEGACERIGMVLFDDEIENHFCGYGERKDEE